MNELNRMNHEDTKGTKTATKEKNEAIPSHFFVADLRGFASSWFNFSDFLERT